ncbi:MAG: GMC family oxidoreductase, partial [Planctomycetaceae bacterium]|nr:GMC family oxidoreductase [Planctomycetaceae bacterium]
IPVPGELMLAKSGLKRIPNAFIHALRKRMLPLCGIVEDLPNPNNRVTLERNGDLSLNHQFSDFDKERGTHLRQEMCRILKRAGAIWCVKREIPSQEHVAHQCGTLRFGTNPTHALADANGRMFSSENLFLADGSIFPTSLGVGPALTIMANALRIASIIAKEV